MRGDLIVDGVVKRNIHLVTMGEGDSIVLYREESGREIEEFYSLVHARVGVIENALEVRGYHFTGEKKGFPEDQPLPGESFRYVEVRFLPYGLEEQEQWVRESPLLYGAVS